MTFSTPGPLSGHGRCARYEALGDSDHPDRSGAGARRLAPGSGDGAGSHLAPKTEAAVLVLGMKLFLASLGMIFGTTFIAYGIIWWKNREAWDGVLETREVLGLAAATVLLVVADIAAMRALKKAPDLQTARKLTLVTLISAALYVVVQSMSWAPLLAKADPIAGGTLRIEGFLFLMLTFAHAAHVLGGIIANGIVYARSSRGRGPTRGALQMLYQYWRFLTAVWIAVLVVLLAT